MKDVVFIKIEIEPENQSYKISEGYKNITIPDLW